RMAKNAQRWSPGSFPDGERSNLAASLSAPLTPSSGIRSAPEPTSSYVPPRPEFDSEPQLTRVTPPDPSLLALARGNTLKLRRGRKRAAILWFTLGALSGGAAVWSVTSDVRADVYRARIWTAETLRALHSQATGEGQ